MLPPFMPPPPFMNHDQRERCLAWASSAHLKRDGSNACIVLSFHAMLHFNLVYTVGTDHLQQVASVAPPFPSYCNVTPSLMIGFNVLVE